MLKPKPHQIEAIQANIEAFKTQDSIKNIMACGSGKTFVFIKTIDELIKIDGQNMQNIIIFAPTIMLIQQIAKATISHFGRSDFEYAIICSKKKAGEIDDISVDEASISLKIDVLDSKKFIIKKISSNIGTRTIFFCTYRSSYLLEGLHFDFATFDEAHRTTGEIGKPYSFAIHDSNVSIEKRLFVTATEKIAYRQKDGNINRIGMNNLDYYGKTAYSLPFKKAIDLGLITDYKVLITIVQHSDISHLLNENSDILHVANSFALEKANRDFNIKKIVTFHSSVERAKNFSSLVKDSNSMFSAYHVSGEQDTNDRKENLQEFINAENAIISNARCLTEGIDSPEIDAVAFLDPRSSTIDIVQAVGRAQRIAKGKEFGYVILPLYVDNYAQALESNFSNSPSFKNIIDVLGVLRNEDEDLRTSLTRSNDYKYKSSLNGLIISDCGSNIDADRLFDSILLEVISSYDSYFNDMLDVLDNYVLEQGHGYVPENYSDKQLASWATFQRQAHRYKTLPKYRIDLLLEHGFVFKFFEYEWIRNFNLYKNTDKALISRSSSVEDLKKLALWERRQRQFFRDGKLDEYKIDQLKSINFIFSPIVKSWDDSYTEIKELVDELGSAKRVTKKDYINQYTWINKNKKLLEKGELSSERVEKILKLLN